MTDSSASLNGLEWNALTYAGHTTWNQHHEHRPGGYVGGTKRRPRAEWHLTRDTHPALISDAEAEAILAQLEARSGLRNRAGDRVYLLSGLLFDPEGQAFTGETNKGQGAYRLGKGRRIASRIIEGAVLDQVFADLAASDTAAMIAKAMRDQAIVKGKPRDLASLRGRLTKLDTRIGNLVRQMGDNPELSPTLSRTIVGMEQERAGVVAELEQAETESKQASLVAAWTPGDVQRLLVTLRESLEADLAEERTAAVREALHGLVEKVVLDLESRTWEIHYKLYAGIKMASPRGSRLPPVVWISRGTLPLRRAA